MRTDRNSYNNILKSISLFGGVQIVQIAISIIRSKTIAVLIGPTGMGIANLINSNISLVESIVGLGLGTSGTRSIAKSYSNGNQDSINFFLTLLRRLFIISGFLGSIITFVFATSLSILAFNSEDYAYAFRIVSIVIFFNQIRTGQQILLQGTYHYKYLAKTTLYGSLIGLVVTVPLYFFMGLKGIVPAIVITSVIQLSLTSYFAKKVSYEKVNIPLKSFFFESKSIIALGISIALSGFVIQANTYLLKIYISNFGTFADVGLYSAGISIATSYVGLILNAMGTDYSPRLAAIASDKTELTKIVNRQIFILLTLMGPLIITLIVFNKFVILILFSREFLAISEMLQWILIGMLFRATSWCISFSIVARGDAYLFFINELVSAIYMIGLNVFLYYLLGIKGLGISFSISYLLYTLQFFTIARIKYDLNLDKKNLYLIIGLFLSSFGLYIVNILKINMIVSYSIGFLLILVSYYFSYSTLKNITDFKSVLRKKIY